MHLLEFECMKYVETSKFCLSCEGKLKKNIYIKVLCIFSHVEFLVLDPICAGVNSAAKGFSVKD